jgi:hypothetical protein
MERHPRYTDILELCPTGKRQVKKLPVAGVGLTTRTGRVVAIPRGNATTRQRFFNEELRVKESWGILRMRFDLVI